MVDRRLLGMVGRGFVLAVKAFGFTVTVLAVVVVLVAAVLGLITVFSGYFGK